MAECTNKTQVGCQREEGIETEMSEEALEKTSESNEGEARERGGKSEIQEKEDPFKKPSVFATPFPPSKKTRATAASVKVNQVKTESSSDKPLNTGRSVIEKGATDLVDEGSGNGASSEIKPDRTSSLENGSDSTESIQKICTDDDHEKVVSKRNTNLQELAQQAKHKLAVKTQGNAKFKPGPPLSYTEPPWGGVAETPYLFEILKNGTILDTVELNEKSFIVFGRLPNCDVPLEHPSISRYHSVVQYRRLPGDSVGEEMGFYVFDLGSTHGTFVNKNKVPPKTYIRLKVGYVLKFGGSTRLFILQGPDSDVEAESELSVTELKDLRRKQKAELERKMMGDCDDDDDDDEVEEEEEEGKKKNKKRVKERNTADIGCFWGMAEDALVEDENEENPFATEFQEDQEAFYIKDPKKALQGFFDREGEELEYEYDAKDQGTWICRVRLPVDDATGRQLVAEVTHTGRKKEAAVQCALEGCRILDARGLLRQEAVSRKRRKKNWEEEDFYDSDDDTFLDRTGAVERKRKDRMKKAGKVEEKPDTFDSLVAKLAEVEKELAETEQKLHASRKNDDHEKVVSKRNTNLQELAQQAKHKLAVKTQGNAKFKPGPPLSYTEPPWGGVAETPYLFEILKNGTILDTVELNEKSFIVFGRLPNCDVPLEHPSISRYHSVVQYRRLPGDSVGEEMGFYVFDLGSTHGTFVNKNKVPPKTYIRLKVGYVLKFGGSTRLFILQGPDSDVEAESELSVTELKDLRRKQKAELERKMMGDCDDDDDDDEVEEEEEEGKKKNKKRVKERNTADIGCFWGMAEDALVEDENEENPFATEFQEDQEAFYIKDPKKALQGFFDREGEELEYEYDAKDQGTWICRVRLPVDDATGRQLVAEVTHTGRKKEAAVQCALEGCRILDARGLLRQEAVSRKRRKKNWEEEDFYDSDDDTFLDRTGAVERKRKDRMKKAGKVEEKPDTFDSLVAKLAEVEKELAETEQKLHASRKSGSQQSSEDPLDAFMSEVRSGSALDSVTRKKLHLHACELKKEGQRLKRLVEITRPTQLPALDSGTESHRSGEPGKPKKLSLPLFGAMKGGSKFKLKTGTIGHLPLKRLDLPEQLFNMKELGPEVEEEEEEEEMPAAQREDESREPGDTDMEMRSPSSHTTVGASGNNSPAKNAAGEEVEPDRAGKDKDIPEQQATPATPDCATGCIFSIVPMESGSEKVPEVVQKKKKKAFGPSRPPAALLSTKYPEDDPDYCVWVPPKDQSGDGRTHLNEKYGY
ncbi:Kanadaptin [Acipenser ruthenus]|uniref:Kanadaptin n=1 Tax=Acipenser ruthenus TaxID=7906 RepID=A0A444U596_ACIRT|nr:Kanadaptin [Acipenser ruthenus]